MKPFRIHKTCCKVLLSFDGQKSLQLGDVASRVGKGKSTVCRHLKRLAAHDLVQRVKLTNRRDSLVFYVSPKGRHLVNVWTDKAGVRTACGQN